MPPKRNSSVQLTTARQSRWVQPTIGIEGLQENLAAADTKLFAAEQKIAQLQSALSSAQTQIADLSAALDSERRQIESLEKAAKAVRFAGKSS